MRQKEVHSLADNVRPDATLTELRLTHTSIGKDRVRELGEAWRTTDSAAARPGTEEREKELKTY
jgi:hypothetical protein